MLAAVAAAAAVVGKADRLYRHAVAATADQALPEWSATGGTTAGQANAGCRTALALMQLYFTNNNLEELGTLPNLEYADPVRCGDAQNPIGCFSSDRIRRFDSQTTITVQSGQTPEVEHYVCLHELLHWQGFGASLVDPTTGDVFDGYIDAARDLWEVEHPGGTVRPDIDNTGHWSIADAGAVGRHESSKSANRELMTPALSLNAQRTDVETYLSAATLLACAWPNARGHRRWCTAPPGDYGCDGDDTCVLDYPEQHGGTTAVENDILPGYCATREAAGQEDENIQAYNERMDGPDPDTGGGGGGGGGGIGDTGGGGGGLSGGAIAGIVVGSVAVVGGGVALAAGSGLLAVPAIVGAETEGLLL